MDRRYKLGGNGWGASAQERLDSSVAATYSPSFILAYPSTPIDRALNA
jgi:hypothetical protein